MTATVVWSPNLRSAVKSFKELRTISFKDSIHEQAITSVEKQAIQKQFSQKSEKLNEGYPWF